jgi:hypothetical protein
MNSGANENKKFTGILKQNENKVPDRNRNKAVVS